MAVLSKQDILAADDAKTELVVVPEWGGEVIVSTMSGHARDQFESAITGQNGGQNLQNIRAKFCAAVLVDEKGDHLFTDKDVAKLGKKSGAALDRVFTVAQRLNRLTDADVEDLAKN